MKILLLEDEIMLADAISEYLTSQNHIVTIFHNGLEALDSIGLSSYDLLVLDINVPGVSGLDLLEKLHTNKIRIPTIYISALVDIEGISRAYDAGCYDYLKKPFHLKELALRINKIMQFRNTTPEHLVLSKSYTYDSSSSTLMCDGVTQTLSKRQSQIIDLLAKNRSRVVDFDQFREYIWDDEYVDNATIRAEVSRLKKSLREDFIQNIRSMGYMIN